MVLLLNKLLLVKERKIVIQNALHFLINELYYEEVKR